MERKLDAVIIGGGPAGLNAALVLGRARKNVIVIDDIQPRNWVTRETHGFLTRDGVSPAEFRRAAQEEIGAYPSVHFVTDSAVSVSGADGDFQITTAQGQLFQSKKLLFAVGKKDAPLTINGLDAVYGKSAFVCPYCDGWELRDQPLALIVKGANAVHLASVIPGWSSNYTIVTNGPDEMTEEERSELKRHNIPVYDSPIVQIESDDGIVRQIVLEDGTEISCRGIFFAPQLVAGSELPAALGCRMTDTGSVFVDEYGKTSVPGVYSAGDAASEKYQAIAAASSGALAAIGMNSELLAEAWKAKG
ncbi:pyridine nucleotide-disulfide oxidoreductase [Paenibacillus sp. PK3_47]|uniref:NAD(P)/FAD-dependent oxidoreductase n=1 Tax=Paenibacillus sp. PK3_47 TaxID=2072642 RepID=UPI00201D7CBB|nr:NAD(P)/FAD-dependent oxidoreductase [Paenibacillus sp. PK3_47]UQZ37707.1 pyridine nucleotide-disulfide oxidoreductase [Paenibacillus sp. PK3_47]